MCLLYTCKMRRPKFNYLAMAARRLCFNLPSLLKGNLITTKHFHRKIREINGLSAYRPRTELIKFSLFG